jgi:hypothetical protein
VRRTIEGTVFADLAGMWRLGDVVLTDVFRQEY